MEHSVQPRLEWMIYRFHAISICQGNFIESPDFQLSDSSWYLRLTLLSHGRMRIALHRRDSGAPKTVTYRIKISRAGFVEFNETSHFDSRNDCGRENLEFDIGDLGHFTNLFITCYIKCVTPHPVAGNGIVTRAFQTEVADAEKENPQNEELSPLDIKDDSLLRESMKRLLTMGSDHDLTICVQGKEFRAHRNILSARSPVFAMMLSHDTKENNTSTISIEDCDPESFHEFLLYVYSGRAENLTLSSALHLYYNADKYDFPVLKEKCVSLLKTSLSVESICDVVLLAVKHQEKELLDVATEFTAQNLNEILVSVGWLNFMSQNPVQANELYNKSTEILHSKRGMYLTQEEHLPAFLVYQHFQCENMIQAFTGQN